MLLTLHRKALFYLGCSAHSLSASCLPGSLDMSQQLPPALPPTGLFRVSAPNNLRYLQERVKLFNVIERCARKAEDLTNQRDYAQGWLAITGHVISTRFTDLASLDWARPHFEHLLEDLNHHRGTYAVRDRPDAHYPVSTVPPGCSLVQALRSTHEPPDSSAFWRIRTVLSEILWVTIFFTCQSSV